MNEQDLRALVRDAIARQAAKSGAATSPADAPATQSLHTLRQHPSHGLFAVPAGGDGNGPCVIEPTVPCNHCGYCKSYGH